MKQRSPDEGAGFHESVSRVYEGCYVHQPRIDKARELIRKYLPQAISKAIVELGCGTADISGPFTHEALVCGIDVSPEAIKTAQGRFPNGDFSVNRIDRMYPLATGILVLSEVLEHLHDPRDLVKKWSARCEYMIVSHPLDEAIDCGLSAGEHQWSFDIGDFHGWFLDNGFERLEEMTFPMGSYTCVMGIGRRI